LAAENPDGDAGFAGAAENFGGAGISGAYR